MNLHIAHLQTQAKCAMILVNQGLKEVLEQRNNGSDEMNRFLLAAVAAAMFATPAFAAEAETVTARCNIEQKAERYALFWIQAVEWGFPVSTFIGPGCKRIADGIELSTEPVLFRQFPDAQPPATVKVYPDGNDYILIYKVM